MLANYFKIALKVLRRRAFFTFASLFGIGFTLTTLLIVSALVDDLLAPRAPEVNLGRTLELALLAIEGGKEGGTYAMFTGPGYALLDRHARGLPGVEAMSVVSDGDDVGTSFVGDRKVESRLRYADPAFWRIMRFRFLEGGPFAEEHETGREPVGVISEATRRRLFGGQPALGRSFVLDGRSLRVVGVVPNVARSRRSAAADVWLPHWARESDEYREQLTGGFVGILLAKDRAAWPGIKAEFRSRLQHVEFTHFEDVRSVRLDPESRLDHHLREVGGATADGRIARSRAVLSVVGVLALFLLLPTVSLINLNLSRILERAPEIGVRKAFGASSGLLVGQFIFESVFLCLVGAALAVLATAVLLRLVAATGQLPAADLRVNGAVLLGAIGWAVLLGLLSGALPAWRMSRLHPVQALRGGIR